MSASAGYVFTRESPGKGLVHVVKKKDVRDFVDIVPEWDTLSSELEAINEAAFAQAIEQIEAGETGADYQNVQHIER